MKTSVTLMHFSSLVAATSLYAEEQSQVNFKSLVPKGIMFGYKIGDKLAGHENAVSRAVFYTIHVVAENPFKPDDIYQVRLAVSVKTKTIFMITSCNCFQDEYAAEKFAKEQAVFLADKYSDYDIKRNGALYSLEIRFNDTYQLTIFSSGNGDDFVKEMGNYCITINLEPIGKLDKEIVKLVQSEYFKLAEKF